MRHVMLDIYVISNETQHNESSNKGGSMQNSSRVPSEKASDKF